MKEDKSYKVILQGEFVDGYDPEEVKDKLATVFKKSHKEVEKLLKKPTAIRKNLTQEVALKYKQGLEKIGVLCYVEGDPKPVGKEEISPLDKKVDPYGTKGLAFVVDGEGGNLAIVDIKMPFFSMVIFIIKWMLASIPVFIFLGAIAIGLYIGLVFFVLLGHH